MKNKNGWMILLIVGLGLLIFAPGLLRFGMVWGSNSMMDGFGLMGHNFAISNPWGWVGSLMTWFIPALGWFLLAIGIVGLIVYVFKPANATLAPASLVEEHTCHACGKIAQPDWVTCPHCGNPLV